MRSVWKLTAWHKLVRSRLDTPPPRASRSDFGEMERRGELVANSPNRINGIRRLHRMAAQEVVGH